MLATGLRPPLTSAPPVSALPTPPPTREPQDLSVGKRPEHPTCPRASPTLPRRESPPLPPPALIIKTINRCVSCSDFCGLQSWTLRPSLSRLMWPHTSRTACPARPPLLPGPGGLSFLCSLSVGPLTRLRSIKPPQCKKGPLSAPGIPSAEIHLLAGLRGPSLLFLPGQPLRHVYRSFQVSAQMGPPTGRLLAPPGPL